MNDQKASQPSSWVPTFVNLNVNFATCTFTTMQTLYTLCELHGQDSHCLTHQYNTIDSISSVSDLPSCPRTAVTPRADVNSDELIHWRLIAHVTSSKSRNGNSGRGLRFLSDSEQPNGHRHPAQCECRLAISVIQNFTERTSWLVGFVPVCPEWGAAVFSGRQAGRHASLPRYYQDTYR